MERRVIGALAPWDEMRVRFRWSIPERFNLARACCDDWAEAEPGRTAIVDRTDGREVWSFGRLRDVSARLAAGLAARGVGPGDRVAILLPQSPWVMAAHFAVHRLGAISLPLFTLFERDALGFRLRDSGAAAVLTDDANLPKLLALRADLPELRTIVTTGRGEGAEPAARLMEAAPLEGCADTAADDPAMMIYTSGTTGAPKGVLHAHRFLWGHLPAIETGFEGFPEPGDVGWTPADWAWIGGLMDLAMPCLFHGVPIVACRLARFDPAEAAALMREERVTVAFIPPTALRMMRRAGEGGGLRLRAVSSGGEALGADLLDWGREALGAPISEIYGQTECNLVTAACSGTQARRPGTLGRAVPGVEVEVQDESGHPCPPGEAGEICVHGSPAAFLGYWRRPEATAEKWRGGWLRTGDLGVLGADGALTYQARGDDVINASGYRVGPTEIETCLCAHPAVSMAAVIGQPDAERGETIAAFVVAEPAEGLEAELIAWVRGRLSPHMAPRRVFFREALPLTATGKVMRRVLREGG